MKKYFLFAWLSLVCAAATAQYTGLEQKEVSRLRELLARRNGEDSGVKKLYDSLLRLADGALREEANPIDTIRTEGLLQGDPRKTATWAALGDMRKIYALALVYRVSGDKKYLDKAAGYLEAWAAVNGSRGDPIDDTNLDPAIEAFDMVKEVLPAQERAMTAGWLQRTAAAECGAPYNRPGRATSYNNWHSHRIKIVGEIAFAIGDTALQAYTVRELRAQITQNLHADGPSADFLTRDALHYHVYDLEPLLKVAIVVQRATGVDYYSWVAPDGSSIQTSVTWLLPYLDGRKTHAEFVNSTVDFDRRRAQNGEASYRAGTLFEPRNGVATLLLAAYFDGELLGLARRLMGTGDGYPAWQAVVDALGR